MNARDRADLFLRACSRMVPSHRRGEWLEEWRGELEALRAVHRSGSPGRYPGVAAFVGGAFPHALWTRREEWTVDSLMQDVRYGLRVLRRGPGFSLAAILTLALGIGANGAIFSMVNGLLLRPPAGVSNPEGLLQIARSYDGAPRWDNWSWPALQLIGRESDLLAGVAGYSGSTFILGRGEETEAAMGEYVSARYFDLLGIQPALGRLLGPADEVAPGAHPLAVLSHGLWMRRFGGDPEVVGKVLHVGGAPYEVVGVAPEGFRGVDALGTAPEIWVPILQRTMAGGRLPFDSFGSSWIYAFGRLREGASYEAAEAAMAGITQRLRDASPENEDIRILTARGIGLSPQERGEAETMTLLLGGIALLVLLLTCANVGNLFLARASVREMEMGVRQALGAGRTRLVRQLVTESVVLALAATAVAIPLVGALGGLLPALLPVALVTSLAPDLRVYLFLGAVGVVAGLLFGAAPAWAMARREVSRTLREGGTTGGRWRTRLRDALVVAQLAISLGLASGAALLGRSVMNAQRADPGFRPDGLLVGFVNLHATGRYALEDMAGYQERLLRELEAIPGVTHAALAGQAPVLGGHSRSTVQAADRPDDPAASFEAENTVVTPGYFGTLGIPLLRGRVLRPPQEEPERVVVVNEALVRRFWPGEDGVGKELLDGEQRLRVVGVVGDVQMRSLRAAPNPGVYYPYHQLPEGWLAVHLRVQGRTSDAVPGLRRAVAAVDPEVPITGITDLRQGLARSLAETRTFGTVVAVFAGLALVLSLLGLYGLISYGVAQRSREMGIRKALGAEGGSLVGLVLRRGVALTVMGLVLGSGLALGVGRALEGVLFGVGAVNLAALAMAAALLFLSAMVAAWIPASRASRVDAAVSLRE